jgi:hypothetical protein
MQMKRTNETKRMVGNEDGFLADAIRAFRTLGAWAWELMGAKAAPPAGESAVPPAAPAEPALAGGVALAREAGGPKTLRELGLPKELAADFEAAFRAMGATEGGLVVGFTFLTTDGVRHPVRLGPGARSAPAPDLAA